jgi:RNA 3'-terminal phosphate cyclase (ATP)
MMNTVGIDGSFGEGGGQVLRTVLALSVITGRPVRIDRIRAGRRRPGLAPQHLTGLLALARVCDADVEGAELRSTEVFFRPRARPRPGDYVFDVGEVAEGGSAGSVTLLLQALLVPLALAGGRSRLTLKGGTHVAWSPPFDYVTGVLLPTLRRIGLRATGHLGAYGFYPVGGGEVRVEIDPSEGAGSVALVPLDLTERGPLQRIRGRAIACNLPETIPRRIRRRADEILSRLGCPIMIDESCTTGAGAGAALCLVAEYDHALAGFSSLGERGKSSERVSEDACSELLEHHESGSAVDPHLADQILLPAAFASGRSAYVTSHVTSHLITVARLLEQLIEAKVRIDGDPGQIGHLTIDGGMHGNQLGSR